MKHRVFVYGTLKRGHSNHGYLANATFLSSGRTARPFYMMESRKGGFPVVLDSNSGVIAPIEGEVYSVLDQELRRLDMLEGNGRMYNRCVQLIQLASGETLNCQMYLGDPRFWKQQWAYKPEDYSLTANQTYNWSR